MMGLSDTEVSVLRFILRRQHELPQGVPIKHDELERAFSHLSAPELLGALEMLEAQRTIVLNRTLSPAGFYAVQLQAPGWMLLAGEVTKTDPGEDAARLLGLLASKKQDELTRGTEVLALLGGDVVCAAMITGHLKDRDLLKCDAMSGGFHNHVLRITPDGRMAVRESETASSKDREIGVGADARPKEVDPRKPSVGVAQQERGRMQTDRVRRDQLIGSWRTGKRLGSGGQGEVWEVRPDGEKHSPPRAMKVCFPADAKARERFQREVSILGQLSHENVVRVIASDLSWTLSATDGTALAFVVMPRALGTIEDPAWATDTASLLRLFRQACAGVAYVHNGNPQVLHRDLKPSNVLVLEEPQRAVITDFGIAVEASEQGDLTGTQEVVGSRFYRAPEVLQGSAATVRSEVYGLGRILERILTGLTPDQLTPRKVPREGRELSEKAARRLDEVISRATAFTPDARYASVEELLADLPTFHLDVVEAAHQRRDSDANAADPAHPNTAMESQEDSRGESNAECLISGAPPTAQPWRQVSVIPRGAPMRFFGRSEFADAVAAAALPPATNHDLTLPSFQVASATRRNEGLLWREAPEVFPRIDRALAVGFDGSCSLRATLWEANADDLPWGREGIELGTCVDVLVGLVAFSDRLLGGIGTRRPCDIRFVLSGIANRHLAYGDPARRPNPSSLTRSHEDAFEATIDLATDPSHEDIGTLVSTLLSELRYQFGDVDTQYVRQRAVAVARKALVDFVHRYPSGREIVTSDGYGAHGTGSTHADGLVAVRFSKDGGPSQSNGLLDRASGDWAETPADIPQAFLAEVRTRLLAR